MNVLLDNGVNTKASIADFLDQFPQTIPVFLEHHMICVGCAMSEFDTLEEAAANYAIPLDRFMTELLAKIRPAK